jgi:hypothetical protein
MTPKGGKWRNRMAGLVLTAAWAASASADAAGASLNPFGFGKVDPSSPVAADVAAAARTPGPYPKFASIPPIPKDVRPLSAWRQSVADANAEKRQLETEAAALSFSLAPGEADGWAQAQRDKIPAGELTPPAADSTSLAESFAAQARARATPPPLSK